MATTTYEPAVEARPRVVIESLSTGRQARRPVRSNGSEAPVPVACGGSAAPSVHGARLTRRGRVVLALAWMLLVAAGVLGVVRPWAADTPAGTGATTTLHVEAGDTLWQVAGEIAPTADLREVVAAIVDLNGLGSAGDISPGDVLVVPVSQ